MNTNDLNNKEIEILDFDLLPDVMEYLDSVEDSAYIDDWCKTIMPDSDEF